MCSSTTGPLGPPGPECGGGPDYPSRPLGQGGLWGKSWGQSLLQRLCPWPLAEGCRRVRAQSRAEGHTLLSRNDLQSRLQVATSSGGRDTLSGAQALRPPGPPPLIVPPEAVEEESEGWRGLRGGARGRTGPGQAGWSLWVTGTVPPWQSVCEGLSQWAWHTAVMWTTSWHRSRLTGLWA